MSATLADPYRGFALNYSYADKPDDHALIAYEATQSQQREKLLSGLSYHSDHAHASSFGTHPQAVLPLPEPSTGGHHEPLNFAPVHQLLPPLHYSYEISSSQDSRKRTRSGSEVEGSRDMDRHIGLPQPIQPLPMDGPTSGPESEMLYTIQSDHSGSHSSSTHGFASPLSLPPPLPMPQHHHHRLPSQASLLSSLHDPSSASPDSRMCPSSVVGQPGMPDPAPRPKGPKLKFTPEEDALLVDLKEDKSLTWKQIADFFPGRTSGTLQVRYCTKLKAKDVVWTDDMVGTLEQF